VHFCVDEVRALAGIFLTIFGARRCVGMLRMNFPSRRKQRRTDADVRNAEYNKLSIDKKAERNSQKVRKKLAK